MTDEVAWSCFEEPKGPGGLVVAWTHDDALDWRGWGTIGSGLGAPTLDTPFYAASIAKQFTAACVADLVLDGRLGLDAPVRELLPELPVALSPIEVRHLLAHTSGLPPSNALDAMAGFDSRSVATNADRVAALSGVELEDRPGQVHRYSNHGYVLLAEVVAAVAAEPFGEYARQRVLRPAGMLESGFVDARHPAPVPGWSAGAEVSIDFTTVGDGGLITTVADLLRWDAWLPTSSVAPLLLGTRPAVPGGLVAHDAWGISIRTHRGQRIESHGGAVEGYLCSAVRFPELGCSFVAMATTDEGGPGAFSDRLRCFVDAVLAAHLDPGAAPWTETHGRPVG